MYKRQVPGDAAGIAAVQVAAWRATYPGLIPEALLAQMTLARQIPRWRAMLSEGTDGAHHVTELAGRIAGFVSNGAPRDDTLRGLGARGARGEIRALYVHPDCVRQGLGRQLFHPAAASLAARGMAPFGLWVIAGNDRAAAFYRRLGGRPVTTQWAEVTGGRLRETAWLWEDYGATNSSRP